MPSERIQRQIDRLLDEADEAVRQLAWVVVRDRARSALALDRENSDALAYLQPRAAVRTVLNGVLRDEGKQLLVTGGR